MLDQRLDARHLLTQRIQLQPDRLRLRRVARDLGLDLRDSLLEDGPPAFQGLAPLLEDLLLSGEQVVDARLVAAGGQLGGKADRVGSLTLGGQPGILGAQRVVSVLEHFVGRARLRVVEPQKHLAGRDDVALPRKDLADQTSLQMLDRLAAVANHHLTRGDGRAGERRQDAPEHEGPQEEPDHGETQGDLAS